MKYAGTWGLPGCSCITRCAWTGGTHSRTPLLQVWQRLRHAPRTPYSYASRRPVTVGGTQREHRLIILLLVYDESISSLDVNPFVIIVIVAQGAPLSVTLPSPRVKRTTLLKRMRATRVWLARLGLKACRGRGAGGAHSRDARPRSAAPNRITGLCSAHSQGATMLPLAHAT